MPQAKSKYKYDGPVYKFGKYAGCWDGITWAVSDAKALANLSYRYKSENGLGAGAAVKLDPDYLYEVTAVEEDMETMEQYHQITLEELYG